MENARLKSHISSTDNYSMAALFVESFANFNNKNNVSVHKQAVFLHLANLGVRDLKGIAGFCCHAKKKKKFETIQCKKLLNWNLIKY